MKDDSYRSLLNPEVLRGRILRFLSESAWVLTCAVIFAAALMLHHSWPVVLTEAAAMVVVSLVVIGLTRFQVRHMELKGASVTTAERILWFGTLAAILGVQLILQSLGPRDLVGVGYLITAPLLALAMLVSALLGPSLSLFTLTTASFLLGMSGAIPISAIVVGWVSGAVGAHAVNPLKQRSDLLRAMTVVAIAQVIIAASTSAMMLSTVPPVLESAAWAAIAAVIATSIFWLAVAVVERIFGLTSDWTLLELCSPEHPLLKELTLRAPGTWAHSVMVGNLAEHAARDIGANPVLARAMAYFHDIGKLVRPSYFIENQRGENLHDQIPPLLSARVIAEHVTDGLELARKHRLPKSIQDAIRQHHGTSLIAFFYGKALATQEATAELESSYRYDGPKPQSREIAILHLADSVEAVSRVIPRGNSEELEIAIRKVIEDRRADGQLDECDLTFRDLRMVEASFLRALGAIRHERIAYPEDLQAHGSAQNSHYDLEQLRAAYPDEHPPHGA